MSAHGDPYSLLPSHIEFERAVYGDVLKMRSEALKETVQAGHDAFNKGQYKEVLQQYDKVVQMEPRNVNFKIIRVDTLVCLGWFAEAFYEFQNANMLDPNNGRLHHRLSLFYLRRGIIDTADLLMTKASPECKENLNAKIAKVKDHLIQGGKARNKDCEWYADLKHVDAMITERADSSKPLEKWAECAKGYEEATKRFPADEKFTRALKISQAELEESKLTEIGKEVSKKSVGALGL